jgi:hypothetical protein
MSVGKLTNQANALVGMAFVVGLGLVILSKFRTVSGIGSDANTALGAFITGIDDYADWVGIIVLVGVGVYLLASFVKNRG